MPTIVTTVGPGITKYEVDRPEIPHLPVGEQLFWLGTQMSKGDSFTPEYLDGLYLTRGQRMDDPGLRPDGTNALGAVGYAFATNETTLQQLTTQLGLPFLEETFPILLYRVDPDILAVLDVPAAYGLLEHTILYLQRRKGRTRAWIADWLIEMLSPNQLIAPTGAPKEV